MKTLLLVGAVVAALWWLSRRAPAAQAAPNTTTNGTAPNSTGETAAGGAPGIVANAYNDPRDSDPVVAAAIAAGIDSTIIPVPTVSEAVARSAAAAGAADRLNALAPTPTISQAQLDWLALQQASVAKNPYYASTGYNGDAVAVAGQVACGAKSSGNPLGRVLDSSFCQGGPHYGADPNLSTGVWP